MLNRYKNIIVLASSSPYRAELLKKLQIEFISAKPEIDESGRPGESPRQKAARLSVEKAEKLVSQYPNHIIIGSDQVAVLRDTELNKPGNRKDCIAQLQQASGNKVDFYTGICVLDSGHQSLMTETDECAIYFRNLSAVTIKKYVDIEKPYDCAGGFKFESLGITLINRFKGDDPNALVGLPLIKLIDIFNQMEIPLL